MTKTSQRSTALVLALAILAATLLAGSQPAHAASCDDLAALLLVPGAVKQKAKCLPDLTTAYTVPNGFSVAADWAGLNDPRTVNPTGVPGIQIDGYFPDARPAKPYVPNDFNGWDHDAQFVIRLPDAWNGKLVIAPPPGNRRQYSSDFIIADWVLSKGYAYASTDKGNVGPTFYLDGVNPGDAVAEWHARVAELTKAARKVVNLRYGRNPERVYLFGISNGGYQVRYAIENDPGLYDGGVDWEGTLFTPEGPNLLTYLPTALKQYPITIAPGATAEQKEAARQAMEAAGFAPGSEFLWWAHYVIYWDLTQRVYREEFDPTYDGDKLAGTPFCASGTPGCDTDYDYASRPQAVKDAVARVSMTGKIKRPLITVQGSLDTLITPATNADPYAAMIAERNRSRLHRSYLVERGNHVDSFVAGLNLPSLNIFIPPDQLEPLLPCARASFEALERWVEDKVEPPASGPIRQDKVSINSCALP